MAEFVRAMEKIGEMMAEMVVEIEDRCGGE
jgi:hypothetical protein